MVIFVGIGLVTVGVQIAQTEEIHTIGCHRQIAGVIGDQIVHVVELATGISLTLLVDHGVAAVCQAVLGHHGKVNLKFFHLLLAQAVGTEGGAFGAVQVIQHLQELFHILAFNGIGNHPGTGGFHAILVENSGIGRVGCQFRHGSGPSHNALGGRLISAFDHVAQLAAGSIPGTYLALIDGVGVHLVEHIAGAGGEIRIQPTLIVPGLHRFHVSTERIRACAELDGFKHAVAIFVIGIPQGAGIPGAEEFAGFVVAAIAHADGVGIVGALFKLLEHPFPVSHSQRCLVAIGIHVTIGEIHVIAIDTVFFPAGESCAGDGVGAVLQQPVTAVNVAAPLVGHVCIVVIQSQILAVHRCVGSSAGFVGIKESLVIGHIVCNQLGQIQADTIAIVIQICDRTGIEGQVHHVRVIAGGHQGVEIVGLVAGNGRDKLQVNVKLLFQILDHGIVTIVGVIGAVYRRAHPNGEGIYLIAAAVIAAREHRHRAHQHNKCQQQGEDAFTGMFHCCILLQCNHAGLFYGSHDASQNTLFTALPGS